LIDDVVVCKTIDNNSPICWPEMMILERLIWRKDFDSVIVKQKGLKNLRCL